MFPSYICLHRRRPFRLGDSDMFPKYSIHEQEIDRDRDRSRENSDTSDVFCRNPEIILISHICPLLQMTI